MVGSFCFMIFCLNIRSCYFGAEVYRQNGFTTDYGKIMTDTKGHHNKYMIVIFLEILLMIYL